MPSETPFSEGAQPRFNPVRMTAMAFRGASQMYDLNMCAARAMLKTQARAAAAFGWPDWSGLFDTTDERTRRLFSDSAEQMLDAAQRASDVAVELQRQVGRLIEAQTVQAAESWHQGLQELGAQAGEGLEQLRETARETADEAERGVEAVAESVRETMHEGAEQARAQVNNGFDRSRQAIKSGTAAAREAASRSGPPSNGSPQSKGAPQSKGGAPSQGPGRRPAARQRQAKPKA